MASPFAVFRRNQKILLAIVGIGAMVAFVFLDPLVRYMGRGARQENPVVVETQYGALKQSDLAGLCESRNIVELFLRRLVSATVYEQIKNKRLDARDQMQAESEIFNFWQQRVMQRSKPGREESAIETLVLSKRAERDGMVVDDRAINDLIRQITEDTLSSQDVQQVINTMQAGRRMNVLRLFDAIRVEMLASRFKELFIQTLGDVPPALRFEYYLRLNRQAKAEAMPLAVADFTGEVSDPSAVDVQKLYDEGKDRYPDPASPEPGFKQPKRAAFQYFKADFAKFRDEFKPQITDEEIREYYDENKSQFRAVDLPGDKPASESTEDAGEKPDETPTEDQAKPEEPVSEEPANDSPADEKPPAEKPSEGDEKPTDKTDASPQTSRAIPGVMRLVSTAEVGGQETTEPDKAADQSADKTPAAEAPAEPADAAQPAAEDAAPKDGAAEPAKEGADESESKPAEKPPEIKYEPLEKVQDTIRDNLATRKASAKIVEIFDELRSTMDQYADELERYNARKGSSTSATAPAALPFAELAKSKGIEAKELPLVTAAEAATEDIGKLRKPVPDPRSRFGFRTEPFAQLAYSENLPTYKATTGEDNDGNGFLFWKTAEEATYVPKLDQIRERVVQAWKLIKARELARRRADEYAKRARTADKSLKEVFAAETNLKIVETGEFTWMTSGSVPNNPFAMQPPRTSEIEGLEYIGNAFMQAVFELSAGEVTVTTNEPQDTVYVVRLEEYKRPLDELQTEFAREIPMRYMSVATDDQRKIFFAWLGDLEKNAKVRWIRPADSGSRRIAEDMPGDDSDF